MLKKNRILAIVPARLGSKRIYHKNIKLFSGKPLIFWTLKAAKGSKYIDTIVVSTDSPLIARTALKYNVIVPFLRPKFLSTDKATTVDTVIHAVNFLRGKKEYFDIVMVLQPTSPLRISADIDTALELFLKKKAKSVISVCESFRNPNWNVLLGPGGTIGDIDVSRASHAISRRKRVFFQLNGAVYISSVSSITQQKSFYTDKTYAYIMPKSRSIDIDDDFDFSVAELLMKKKLVKTGG